MKSLSILVLYKHRGSRIRTLSDIGWYSWTANRPCALFRNENFVENIESHKNEKFVKVHTNNDTQMSSLVDNYPIVGIPVWYNKSSSAKVLSLAAIRKLYRVTMDTTQEAVMHVHVPEIETLSFVEMPIGLYCHNVEYPNYRTHKLNNHVSTYYFVNMVVSRLKLYSSWEIKMRTRLDSYIGIHHSRPPKDLSTCLT